MFTGLIEELGTIHRIRANPEGKLFEIRAAKVIDQVAKGDSIAVNGACLTVVSVSDQGFSAQAVQETLDKSTLQYLPSGTKVNLERPIAANGRFGGHFVQGHVDGIGRITNLRHTGKAALVSIEIPADLMRYIILKGSIAIDGISLTVAGKTVNQITIAIIPVTFQETNLQLRKISDYVNIEVDMLAKYMEQFAANPPAGRQSISEEIIKKWGY